MEGLKMLFVFESPLFFKNRPEDVTKTGQTHWKNREFWTLVHQNYCLCTDKKENQIFLTYEEIQSGAVEKSYMRKSF
jgi:hypothetical protein